MSVFRLRRSSTQSTPRGGDTLRGVSTTTYNQAATVTSTQTATMSRQTNKTITVGSAQAAAIVRQVAKTLSAGTTALPAIAKLIGKTFTVTVAQTATQVRQATINFTVGRLTAIDVASSTIVNATADSGDRATDQALAALTALDRRTSTLT